MKKPAPLKFRNGTFKIMAIGDLHEPFDLSDPLERRKTEDTLQLLNAALDREKPDLAVFLGDQGKDDDEEKTRVIFERFLAPLKARGVPYAVVFGNHDPECAVPLKRQLELYREAYDNFYTFDGAPGVTGCGNCVLQVLDSAGENDVLNLWFADSGNRWADESVSYYDWMKPDQIEWYKKTERKLRAANGGKTVPAVWFMHIPVPEERLLTRPARLVDYPFSVQGFGSRKGKRFVKCKGVKGYLGEDPACAEVNSGIFDAWKERGDVMAAVFGHDHMNEFAGEVDGILLCQCKTGGFHVYTDGCSAGVRIFTFREENVRAFETHMTHFKELGLRSLSLGFVQRHFHDRQIINMHVALIAAAGLAAVCGGAWGLRKALKAKR